MPEKTEKTEKTEKKESKPSWIKTSKEELKNLIVDLANQGNSPARIGLILRDEKGIPKSKLLGKRISQILNEESIEFKSQKSLSQEKVDKLKSHLDKNKHDYSAQRSLTKQLWTLHKINKLER